jgi:hypothetical protein
MHARFSEAAYSASMAAQKTTFDSSLRDILQQELHTVLTCKGRKYLPFCV